MSVQRILPSDLGYKPYHSRPTQELKETDFSRRVIMANNLLNLASENQNFFEKIIFSDEAKFNLVGGLNTHNMTFWSGQNPHFEHASNSINQSGLMVWCGIWAGGKIGPYFYPQGQKVNGKTYLEMIQRYVIPRITSPDLFWMQDGAPGHRQRDVVRYLDAQFPDRWIGMSGPIDWAPRSPDLNVCDNFLWGYLQAKVWSRIPKPHDLQTLRRAIEEEFNSIDQEMIARACRGTEGRLQQVIAAEGRSIQNFGGR